MSSSHDPIRHLEYLRQSLSQDKKPIGFFISAGCPLAVTMPSKEEWPLIPDVKNLTNWINKELIDNEKYQNLLVELEKTKKDRNNIEDILSFIRGLQQVSEGGEVRGFSESDLNDLEKAVCQKIVQRINVSLPDNQTPYHKLVKWISSIDREFPTEIFTTNYDLLMEDALDYLEVPYFDGFVGSRKSFFDLRAVNDGSISKCWTRLWKIHGSINWNQIENNGVKKIYRSSEVKLEANHLIYPSHLKYEQSRKMPYLALIDQLSRFIREKSSLLILSGYSFNDEHLNDTIINALKANPSAMVLAFMFDTYFIKDESERYPNANKLAKDRHNLNIWTFDKAIIGTNLGDWKVQKTCDDNDIKQFIAPEDESVKLGDFSVFADFLKMLIGNKKEEKDDK
jgi:hypothetical protein